MTRVILKPFTREANIERFFNDFSENLEVSFNSFPKVDVVEDNDSLNLIAELPGVKKEDVKIILEDGVLTISGEKKNELISKEDINIFNNERIFGKFERKFKLTDDINPDEVTAKYENGLLKIKVAKLKPEEPKERIIEVK
jgi:HSP20 family protein